MKPGLNRREMALSALGAVALSVTGARAQSPEPILEPDLPIIDAHHHLVDGNERYLFEEYVKDVRSGHRIDASVYIEVRSMYRAYGPEEFAPLGEIEFARGAGAMADSGKYGKTRVCASIVGYADLSRGARVREVLEAEIAAGGGRLSGIRYSAAWDADKTVRSHTAGPGLLNAPGFREGFAELEPLGLSFDAWVFFTQLDDVIALAKAFPNTTIILNHAGGPLHVGKYAGDRSGIMRVWRARMAELAKHENVRVKLGGLGLTNLGFGFHERTVPPTSEELASAWRPYIEPCIELFGPTRAMFESNFPVDKRSCSYAALWNAFKLVTKGMSQPERTALFSGTAKTVYRIA